MNLKFVVIAYGLAALLGGGAVILTIMNNPNWKMFLAASIAVFLISKLFDLIKYLFKTQTH